MSAPSSSPQDQFFMAARTGSVSGMQEACAAGADPSAFTPDDVSAWECVALNAPLPSLKACFAFLKSRYVPLFCAAHAPDKTHPALLMLDGCAQFSPLESARMFWRLWSHMSVTEQHRVLKEEDVNTYLAEHCISENIETYMERIYKIWEVPQPTCFPFLSDTYRTCAASLLSLPRSGCAPSPFLTQESLVVLVRSLHLRAGKKRVLEYNEGVWGALCATAPLSTLKACLANPALSVLLHNGITSSLKALKEKDYASGLTLQHVCLRIIRRCHNAGLRWPDQWPEETREALLAFPEIHAWLDRRALKKSLDAPSLVSVLRRARV